MLFEHYLLLARHYAVTDGSEEEVRALVDIAAHLIADMIMLCLWLEAMGEDDEDAYWDFVAEGLRRFFKEASYEIVNLDTFIGLLKGMLE